MSGQQQLAVFVVVSLTVLVAHTWAARIHSVGPGESERRWFNDGGVREQSANSSRRWLIGGGVREQSANSSQGLATEDRSYLGFPENLKETFKSPKYLGTGGFGEVWLVTHDGKLKVVKLLHLGQEQFLTWKLANQVHMRQDLFDAAGECDTSKDMRHGGRSNDEGSKYIMDCYWHNIREPNDSTSPSMDDPRFLVIEHCGDEDLYEFRQRRFEDGTWGPELVMDIYVQLLEALAYLGRHPKKWVHHDLKPSNIVISTSPEGKVELHLVDFGGAAKGNQGNQFEITASTQGYYPFEWAKYMEHEGVARINFAVCANDIDGRCPQAFDMFSATSILVELISWYTPLDRLSGGFFAWRTAEDGLSAFKRLRDATQNPGRLVEQLVVGEHSTAKAFKTKGTFFNKVLVKALECLGDDPEVRPTAKEVLAFVKSERKSHRSPLAKAAVAVSVGSAVVWAAYVSMYFLRRPCH